MIKSRLAPLWVFLLFVSSLSQAEPLKVGITLHPYYSYVANIVKDRAELVPLVDAGFNPHSYELQPADLKRLMTMDALVVNGIGHDEFAFRALEALEAQNGNLHAKLKVIEANKDVPLLASTNVSGAWNPHTFVSISAAIRQVYTIAKELGELDPDWGVALRGLAWEEGGRFAEWNHALGLGLARDELVEIPDPLSPDAVHVHRIDDVDSDQPRVLGFCQTRGFAHGHSSRRFFVVRTFGQFERGHVGVKNLHVGNDEVHE